VRLRPRRPEGLRGEPGAEGRHAVTRAAAARC